jgi:hypothetical protein
MLAFGRVSASRSLNGYTWPLSLLRIEASIAVAAQLNGCVG